MPQGASDYERGSLLGEALRSITRFSSRRPRATLWFVLVLACAAAGLTVCYIRFKTDRADLIDPDAAFHRRWLSYTESFGDTSELVVVVEADNPVTIKQVLDDLGTRMQRESEPFRNVLYKVEPGALREKGLQYLSPEQLQAGLERLDEYSPVVRGRWDLVRIDSLVSRLRYQLESRTASASSGGPGDLRPLLRHAELLSASMARYLVDRNDFRNPWPDIGPIDPRMRDEGQQVIYFLNDQGNMGFLKALPVKKQKGLDGTAESIDRLRELTAEVSTGHPTARIGVTGIPVLESDEMRRSQDDMLKASLISIAGVSIVLILGFRGFRHPALALVMLAVGMAWACGYTTLVVGHLNILSVSFAVILIGLGIDFGIHYLARYLELRHEGQMLRPALLETSSSVGTGIVTAAVTTALAFLCATLTRFLGVAELGIIAGGGILLCALATFVVLPALVSLADQSVEPRRLPTPFQGNVLRTLTSRFPLVVLLASLGVIVGVGVNAVGIGEEGIEPRVHYDYNLLNLQADGLESVDVQKRVFKQARDSLLYAVSLADTPEEARRLRAKFEALPSVHHVEGLASRLPASPPEETRLLVQAFRAQLARLPGRPPQLGSANPAVIGRTLEKFYLRIRNKVDADAVEAARAIDEFLDRFERLSLRDQMAFLGEYQARMAGALLGQLRALAAASNSEPVTLADLPAELTSRFVSRKGDKAKWLLQIYPKEPIWDIEPLSRFAADVRSVDPDATGTPLQNFEASRQIVKSYERAALYALAVIFFVLLVDFLNREQKLLTLLPPLIIVGFIAMTLHTRRADISPVFLITTYVAMVVAIAATVDFRNLRDTLLTLLPPLLGGGLMMFGILALLGVDLNPANLIALPLVLGIGVDDGVHVIHDFRLQKGRYRTSSSTMNAIVLTSLTSMIGFGSMMVAAHRGLYSVGLVLVIGVGSCLFVSLVTLPAVLTMISGRQPEKAETAARDRKPAPKPRSKERAA